MIGNYLKEYKKQFKKDCKDYRRRPNSDWKKRWMPMIKYDHDFDGAFLIALIVHKLHIMLDYYEHGKYCMQVDESRLEIVDSLREACRLGDMLIADEFDYPAYEIMEAHMHMSSKPSDKKGLSELVITWDSPADEEAYNMASEKADKERLTTEKKFFDYICKNYHMWWD